MTQWVPMQFQNPYTQNMHAHMYKYTCHQYRSAHTYIHFYTYASHTLANTYTYRTHIGTATQLTGMKVFLYKCNLVTQIFMCTLALLHLHIYQLYRCIDTVYVPILTYISTHRPTCIQVIREYMHTHTYAHANRQHPCIQMQSYV